MKIKIVFKKRNAFAQNTSPFVAEILSLQKWIQMIKSMTGFGKALVAFPNKNITVEIKALNSKYFDFTARISSSYKEYEPAIRSLLNELLERGKVELILNSESSAAEVSFKINEAVAEAYLSQIYGLKDRLKLPDDPNLLSTILKMPDVMSSAAEELGEAEWALLENGIKEAAAKLNDFRLDEGRVLQNDFVQRIALIRQYAEDLVAFEEPRIALLKARFKKNLESLTEDASYDTNRFEQELIYYIEKLDITEEKVRLTRHLDYFTETLGEKGSNGKKLSFIAQEIGREVNTIGSKANDADIQKRVVMMKDELEKIKEQLSNIL